MMHLEVSLTVVAALLTVIGYSLNDTIIIFDRVRENLKKARPEPLHDVLNRSINETLPRSILTHATVLAATLALLIFAGEVIRPFSWIMFVRYRHRHVQLDLHRRPGAALDRAQVAAHARRREGPERRAAPRRRRRADRAARARRCALALDSSRTAREPPPSRGGSCMRDGVRRQPRPSRRPRVRRRSRRGDRARAQHRRAGARVHRRVARRRASRAAALAAAHPGVRATHTAGVHPHDAAELRSGARPRRRSAREVGARRRRRSASAGSTTTTTTRRASGSARAFAAQLALAARARPAGRRAHARGGGRHARRWSSRPDAAGVVGVLHCYTGSLALAEAALAVGLVRVVQRHHHLQEVDGRRRCFALVPDDRLLVESDAPYLAPVPHRGKRNEPAWVSFTVARLAAARGVDAAAIGAAHGEQRATAVRVGVARPAR